MHVDEQSFERVELPADKRVPVLVYGHGEAYKFAQLLSGKGYENIYLLNSLYDFFWSSFNVAACKDAKDYLINHTGIY